MQRGEGAGLKIRWERRKGTFAVGLKTDLERLSVSKKNAKEEKVVLLIWGAGGGATAVAGGKGYCCCQSSVDSQAFY